jgi:hypothetical protein
MPDAEVAAKIGLTAIAVRVERTWLGIPRARDRRRREFRTPGEDS